MKRSSIAAITSGARAYQGLFLGATLALLPMFRHEINPDAISYWSIAGHYLDGKLGLAVNAYWGPLLSWLLAPLRALGLDLPLAGRILMVATGLAAVTLTYRLFLLYPMALAWRRLALVATVAACVSFACGLFEPDLLLVCILLGYLIVLFGPAYAERWNRGLACGLLGGLAYLTKAYGLFFFLVHFTLVSALMAADARGRHERRQVLRNLALGLAVCLGISMAWAGALTHKYGYPTLGTTGRYNHATVGPDAPGDPPDYPGHPALFAGFIRPANAEAVSAWEDPSLMRIDDWSALASQRNAAHQFELVIRNLREMERIFARYSHFYLIFVTAFVFACAGPLPAVLARRRFLYPLVTLAVYPLGYVLIAVDHRYLYLPLILLNLMAGLCLDRLDRTRLLTPGRRHLAMAVFLVAAVYMPARFVVTNARADDAVFRLSRTLRAYPELKGNVASNRRWNDSLSLAYYLGLRYYGAQGLLPTEAVLPALNAHGVRYYFVWNASAAERQAYSGLRDILSGTGGKLAIYDLGSGPSGARGF